MAYVPDRRPQCYWWGFLTRETVFGPRKHLVSPKSHPNPEKWEGVCFSKPALCQRVLVSERICRKWSQETWKARTRAYLPAIIVKGLSTSSSVHVLPRSIGILEQLNVFHSLIVWISIFFLSLWHFFSFLKIRQVDKTEILF